MVMYRRRGGGGGEGEGGGGGGGDSSSVSYNFSGHISIPPSLPFYRGGINFHFRLKFLWHFLKKCCCCCCCCLLPCCKHPLNAVT